LRFSGKKREKWTCKKNKWKQKTLSEDCREKYDKKRYQYAGAINKKGGLFAQKGGFLRRGVSCFYTKGRVKEGT